ncbi:MAG: hypothetical protein Q9208_008519 [Pyrenodesmia sp. 3 TL-2023]
MLTSDFKRELLGACDRAIPSYRSKRYTNVKVLLVMWDQDDLGVQNDVDRLSSGKWEVTAPNGTTSKRGALLDFSSVKKDTLDLASADVLYVLDSCHAATSAIGPGKELLAACSVEAKSPGLEYYSFTTALVQELTNAVSNNSFLTAAQLHYLMLEKAWRGHLPYTPIHVETMVDLEPRTSILLAPLVTTSTPSGTTIASSSGPQSLSPLTGSNATPVGCRVSDVKVLLSVSLRDAGPHTLQQLKDWLETQRPPGIHDIGVSFEYAAPSSSMLIIFVMPVAAWYCLQSHPAVSFIRYVQFPEPPSSQQPTQQPTQEGSAQPLENQPR